jgi:hypothetical protein
MMEEQCIPVGSKLWFRRKKRNFGRSLRDGFTNGDVNHNETDN